MQKNKITLKDFLNCVLLQHNDRYNPFSASLNTCDLANANTTMPATLVSVIPDKTLLPVTERDSLARANFDPDIVV